MKLREYEQCRIKRRVTGHTCLLTLILCLIASGALQSRQWNGGGGIAGQILEKD